MPRAMRMMPPMRCCSSERASSVRRASLVFAGEITQGMASRTHAKLKAAKNREKLKFIAVAFRILINVQHTLRSRPWAFRRLRLAPRHQACSASPRLPRETRREWRKHSHGGINNLSLPLFPQVGAFPYAASHGSTQGQGSQNYQELAGFEKIFREDAKPSPHRRMRAKL